ncbi:ER-based factor for assembly of V-ATPase [Trifolium repens]|nr:ER-based factor for assembly of V-ATPase [Trifolium repens]
MNGACLSSSILTEKPRMSTDNNSSRVGLVISNTDSIRVFLSGASNDTALSSELRQTSSDLLIQSDVPYEPLRAIWIASDPSTRPKFTQLFSGTSFIFSSPKPREKSEELKARLKKLQDLAERKAYQELVKDIAPKEVVQEPFSSYKDQLGFGLHVLVTMFTGYLVGFAAFRALFDHSPAMNAAGGILGLVGAMLVETFLFIIRSSNPDVIDNLETAVALFIIEERLP